jgi:tmRNA-binding protein
MIVTRRGRRKQRNKIGIPLGKRGETMGMQGSKIIARNKKATYDYQIEETFEAGIVLTGTEIICKIAMHGLTKENYLS